MDGRIRGHGDQLDRGRERAALAALGPNWLRRHRLGARAAEVDWIVANIVDAELPSASYDLWHDRAAFHFLTATPDVDAYVRLASRTLVTGGHALVAGFASDGPERCSGLTVARREPAEIAALFGTQFELIESAHETHATPWGAPQHFAYPLLRKR